MSETLSSQTDIPKSTKTKKSQLKKKTTEPFVLSRKSSKTNGDSGKKKRYRKKKSKNTLSLASYIFAVLKQVAPHPSDASGKAYGISKKAMTTMDQITEEVCDRIIKEAVILARFNKRLTIRATEIQAAVRLVYPDGMAKYAVSEGTKAVTRFNADQEKSEEKKKKSKSQRSGLDFPVGRIRSYMKANTNKRVSTGAGIFLAAALEYLVAEIMEVSKKVAFDNKKRRITPRFLCLAVKNDKDFDILLNDTVIANGGVQPHIHTNLRPPRKRSSSKKSSEDSA